MILRFILLEVVFLAHERLTASSISTHVNRSVINCQVYGIEEVEHSVDIPSIKTETCLSGGKCRYELYADSHDKYYGEIAKCDDTPRDFQSSFNLTYRKGVTIIEYSCNTELCNSKTSPIYLKLQKGLSLMNKTMEILDKVAERQGNRRLYCYDTEKKKSTRCDTSCLLYRKIGTGGENQRQASCMSDDVANLTSPKEIGVLVYYTEDGIKITTVSNCYYSDCNREGSVIDKFLDEIKEIVYSNDEATSKPTTSESEIIIS